MIALSILLIGFSIFSAFTLALTHFRGEYYQEQVMSRIMGLILLLALSGLQLAHFSWLYLDQTWVTTLAYRMTLFTIAPAFFLFSLPLLNPPQLPTNRLVHFGHAVPIIISPMLAENLALPLAFIVGAGYLLGFARNLYTLRRDRENFRLEMILLGGVFAIAIGVSILGLLHAMLPDKLFYSLYSISIGLAFILVQTTLGMRPQLSNEVRETALSNYVSSTLTNVDCELILAKIGSLMKSDKIYENPDLSLPNLAQNLGLSPHQLSELINVRLGKGFSRYLREQRINAAKSLLCDEPSASVLSVGLSVGFTSQSNFYEAFREIEGMTPGQFRKINIKGMNSK